jgi:cytosolic carboxypeptidase protein 2/3
MHGFINFLCSPKAKELRSKILFKIVPMVNVDGVVAGNFRTNLLGRDLNRYFHRPESIEQTGMIRSLATKFKPFMFLDFHGHSSRKNIFTYGPDYSIDNRYFLPSRVFPKLISKYTKSFRYYSCNFRITGDKVNTGRAVMLRNHQVIYSFTV